LRHPDLLGARARPGRLRERARADAGGGEGGRPQAHRGGGGTPEPACRSALVSRDTANREVDGREHAGSRSGRSTFLFDSLQPRFFFGSRTSVRARTWRAVLRSPVAAVAPARVGCILVRAPTIDRTLDH